MTITYHVNRLGAWFWQRIDQLSEEDNMQIIKQFAIWGVIVLLLCMIDCGTSTRYYSILDSAPFPAYNPGNGPDIMNTKSGLSMGIGGHYVHILTNADTTVHAGGIMVSPFRWRYGKNSEIGATLAWCELLDESDYSTNPHLSVFLDFKQKLLDRSFVLTFNPGFGLNGTEADGVAYDMRLCVILGKRLYHGNIVPYLSPTIHGLWYVYRTEGTIVTANRDYGLAPIYGVSAGLDYNAYKPSPSFQIHLIFECSILRGHETTGDKITFGVIKPSLMLRAMF
jgi:hypothetical protein